MDSILLQSFLKLMDFFPKMTLTQFPKFFLAKKSWPSTYEKSKDPRTAESVYFKRGMHGSIKFPIQWNQNFKVTPTQNFDEIWFWITDFTASVLWVKAITHMHNIIYDSYIMNSRFSDEVCYNYDLEKNSTLITLIYESLYMKKDDLI